MLVSNSVKYINTKYVCNECMCLCMYVCSVVLATSLFEASPSHLTLPNLPLPKVIT